MVAVCAFLLAAVVCKPAGDDSIEAVPMMRKATDEEAKKLPMPKSIPEKIVSGPDAEGIQPAIGVLNAGDLPEE